MENAVAYKKAFFPIHVAISRDLADTERSTSRNLYLKKK